MGKFIYKNGIKVRIIKSTSLSKHWMRRYYKSLQSNVAKWNLEVDKQYRIQMNADFNSVRKVLVQKISSCQLDPKTELTNVFLTAMKWTGALEKKALKTKEAKLQEAYLLELNASIYVVKSVIKSISLKNPEAKKWGAVLIREIRKRLVQQEIQILKMQKNATHEKSRTQKGLVLSELASVLSKKTKENRQLKNSRAAAGEIIEFIFSVKLPKSGWASTVGTAVSRYKNK